MMTEQTRCEPLEEMARDMIGASGLPVNLIFVTQNANVVAVIVENHDNALENALSYARGLSGIVLVEKTDHGIYWENDASQALQDRLGSEEGELCLNCHGMDVDNVGSATDGRRMVKCQGCGNEWVIKVVEPAKATA